MRFKEWLNETEDNRILFYGRDREQYGFMSNFHMAPFELDGQRWPSVEHYYMAMKSERDDYRQQILGAHSPGKAKRLGDSRAEPHKQSLFRKGHALRADWDSIKVDVMRRAVYAKFSQNPGLKQALLATGNAELIEDSPRDMFWGSGADGSGQNWLGRILMEVRGQLQ
jgi:ribA/ribD-fused uncharacterized protein